VQTAGLNLLISDKADTERDDVARAFQSGGGAVHRIARFWDPPSFDVASVRVYGAESFCLVLQQKLGFTLCSPDDELLAQVPYHFLNRNIERRTLSDIRPVDFPIFIKSVTPKQFRGAVYRTTDALASECRGLSPETPIFVSEVVTFTSEFRSFVLRGHVLDTAIYEGAGVFDRHLRGRQDALVLTSAVEFVTTLIESVALPRTVVVDVGLIEGGGWAVIEFNASWGAGLNGCDAEKVLPAIISATGGLD
jgi:hypothetical protein